MVCRYLLHHGVAINSICQGLLVARLWKISNRFCGWAYFLCCKRSMCVVHISVTYSCYLSHYSTILAITIQAAVYISEIAPRNIRGGFTSAGSVIKIIIYLDQRTNSICLPCAYILPIYCS